MNKKFNNNIKNVCNMRYRDYITHQQKLHLTKKVIKKESFYSCIEGIYIFYILYFII